MTWYLVVTLAYEAFTAEEEEILSSHFSNIQDDVFCITTPSQIDRGALMSRYSRSSKSMRRVFLDEFLNNENRGNEFYERVLVEYGDDSVAELGTAQVGIEGISNIAIQDIEDRRIGLSYLEKSSRYVSYVNNHSYYTGNDVAKFGELYTNACDLAFESYDVCVSHVGPYLQEIYKLENYEFTDSTDGKIKPFHQLSDSRDIAIAERAYNRTLNAMTLDVCRGLLPAGTLTNVGITGNGRAFEYLICTMLASRNEETISFGKRLSAELGKVIGPFVRRATQKYGTRQVEYLQRLKALEDRWVPSTYPEKSHPTISLVTYEPRNKALNSVIAGLMYPGGARQYGDMRLVARNTPRGVKSAIIRSFAEARRNRRERPPRAFELTSYTFNILSNFGMFRDLHRHRILTMQRQPLTISHGYTMPQIFEDTSLSDIYKDTMQTCGETYREMAKHDMHAAQYVVNFAYRYNYMIRVNLRELCHIVELRTLPQGHEDYRYVARHLYNMVQKAHPELSYIIRFCDMNDYNMGRMGSEVRTASKVI